MGRKLSLTNLAKAVQCTSVTEENTNYTNQDNNLPSTSSAPAVSPSALTTTLTAALTTTRHISPLSSRTRPLLTSSMTVHYQGPQTSTATEDTSTTLLASSFASSTSLSSILQGSGEGTEQSSSLDQQRDNSRPLSKCSISTLSTSASAFGSKGGSEKASSRSRSRAADMLLNLESSSNDARFQEILHNTIALDHFRQFCFQEYSIENLLFWLDVELFSKPSKELLEMDRSAPLKSNEQDFNDDKQDRTEGRASNGNNIAGHFAVQHARYIYLTYIDSNAPLQVNLSDETRTDILWPLLDPASPDSPKTTTSEDSQLEGWPLDRRMFDAAQEHTYQLMKGHTLVRFEESSLWKAVDKIIREDPERYAKAAIIGPLNSHYKPDVAVITSTVARSRSRHPSAKPQTLYNWNNSTSDLDRSRDKEEALAMTMSQYFGPIPLSIRHPARVIVGLGGNNTSRQDDDDDDVDDLYDRHDHRRGRRVNHGHENSHSIDHSEHSTNHSVAGSNSGERSTGRSSGRISSGLRKARFSRLMTTKRNESVGSNLSDESTIDPRQPLDEDPEDSMEKGKRVTRWMVAGYFNDQVRLTAAQRKRLLRRNNKLTKFFGSRVDGTLRPVDELNGQDVPAIDSGPTETSGAAGAGSIPKSTVPLAYAVSSSIIHDLGKGSTKKNIKAAKKMNKKTLSYSEIELRLVSANLLQKLRKSMSVPPEQHDSMGSSLGQGSFTGDQCSSSAMEYGQQTYHPFDNVASQLPAYAMARPKEARLRSVTVAADLASQRRFVAHPHPLWSGSLSDQESGPSTAACERRRDLSIVSLMGDSDVHTNNASGKSRRDQDGATAIPLSAPDAGITIDRQEMLSRRKKADKLSMFFGATLTKQELASQLTMADEDDRLVEVCDGRLSNDSRRSGEKGSKNSCQEHRQAASPPVSYVNQLSHRERSILWKRSKKLKELLGESLPEAEVAHALTRPVLLLNSSRLMYPQQHFRAARRNSNARPLRTKRLGSVASLRDSTKQATHGKYGPHEDADDSDDYEDEEDEEQDGMNLATPSVFKGRRGSGLYVYQYGRKHWKPRSISRSGSFSSTGSCPRRKSLRPAKSSDQLFGVGHRSPSLVTLDSAGTSQSDVWLLTAEEKQAQATTAVSGSEHRTTNSTTTTTKSMPMTSYIMNTASLLSSTDVGVECLGERFNRKKKMDKIHQFLGDRVPERDLWIGAVGRERTMQMMDLISTNTTGSSCSNDASSSNPMSPTRNSHGTPNGMGLGLYPLFGALDANATMSGSTRQLIAGPGALSTALGHGADRGSKPTAPIMAFQRKHVISGHGIKGDKDGHAKAAASGSAPGTSVRLERSLSDPPLPSFSGLKMNPRPGAQRASEEHVRASRELGRTQNATSTVVCLRRQLLVSRQKGDNPDGGMKRIRSEEGENVDPSTSIILSRLLEMSEEDQELFLRRAEKLEKMFGAIPPSALLESSLTILPPQTKGCSLSSSSELPSSTSSSSSPLSFPSLSSTSSSSCSVTTGEQQPRSLVELAGLLATSQKESAKDDVFDGQQVSAATVESLGISDTHSS
ncbi:hypothetical protein BGZ94_009709 [Podila epigama]|nr:hypothetical protein BGZ94_009709 [Podila epigama]